MVVTFHPATLATRRALPLTCAGLPPAGSRQLALTHGSRRYKRKRAQTKKAWARLSPGRAGVGDHGIQNAHSRSTIGRLEIPLRVVFLSWLPVRLRTFDQRALRLCAGIQASDFDHELLSFRISARTLGTETARTCIALDSRTDVHLSASRIQPGRHSGGDSASFGASSSTRCLRVSVEDTRS